MTRLLRACAIVVAAMLGMIVCAWLVGRILTDQFAWSQWLWWIPTQVAIICSAVVFAVALVPGEDRRRWAIRSLATGVAGLAICGYFLFIEHRMMRSVMPVLAETNIRIVHINSSRGLEDSAVRIAGTLERAEADVVVFSFALRASRQMLRRSMVGEEYELVERPPFSVLSQYPVLEVREIINSEGIAVALLRLEVSADRTLSMFLVDMPSDPKIGRMQLAGKVRRWLDEVDLMKPDLVVGDFNITRNSASLERMFPGYRNAFNTAGAGYGATFPETALYHIDNVLHLPDVAVVQYFLLDESFGPHRAQVIDIAE